MKYKNNQCFIIAEIAQAHDGSLGTAHAFIDAAADIGADALKFQTHIAEAESTLAEPWRVKFSQQDETRYDYWKRMEFTSQQWQGLADHCKDRSIEFLSTPFSFAAIDLLEIIGIARWKVASGEVTNLPAIERMAKTGKQVILSSGVSTWDDLDRAAEVVRRYRAPLAILQCSTLYPTPPESVGLNVLQEIRTRYVCQTGLSDHSGTIYAGLAAAALGADIIEVHITFSRKCFGPDVKASITIEELGQLVQGVRFIQQALASPVNKDEIASGMKTLKETFGKSIVASKDMEKGYLLRSDDLSLKKPGGGLVPSRINEFEGRILRNAVVKDQLLKEEDFD